MITNETLEHISQNAPAADDQGSFPEEAFQRLSAEGLLKITLPQHALAPGSQNTALATGRIYDLWD